MNNVFVKTKNVLRSIELIDNLRERGSGVPGFGLIYSEPGLGKTETCTWFVGRKGSNAAYVRAKAAISHRWFFEMIVNALGAAPFYRFSDLFKQASDLLLETDAMLIIDEVDFCCHDSKVLESLRDLHDECGNTILLIGMGSVDKKLMRHRHFFSRIGQIYRFQALDEEDIAIAARELCEYTLSDEACNTLASVADGSFRSLKIIINHLEVLARRNSLKEIDAAHITNLDWRAKR
jgi:DNA transposition AAA+ family ATPase